MKLNAIKILIIIFIFYTSCEEKKKINYYPSNLNDIKSKYQIEDSINLDDFLKEHRKKIIKNSDDITPYFKIEDDYSVNYVKLDIFRTGHFKSYNCLEINYDTIWYSKPYSLRKIDSILPEHFYNYGNSYFGSSEPKKAFVMVQIDTTSKIKDLKEIYSKVLYSYKNNVENKGDSTDLLIKWNWLNFLPPPPPPPKETN